MKRYFITGIDTGVGKTLVTACLAYQLRAGGNEVTALKPVLSGIDQDNWQESDAAILSQAQGLDDTRDALEAISPWQFKAPLSPHLAAANENRAVDPSEIIAFCASAKSDTVLVEGVGGIMVPLTNDYLVLDWMKALGWPVILVSSSYLGAINHTLMTMDLVRRNQLPIAGIVVSESTENNAGLDDTVATITRFAGDTTIFPLPRLPGNTPFKNSPSLLSLIA